MGSGWYRDPLGDMSVLAGEVAEYQLKLEQVLLDALMNAEKIPFTEAGLAMCERLMVDAAADADETALPNPTPSR